MALHIAAELLITAEVLSDASGLLQYHGRFFTSGRYRSDEKNKTQKTERLLHRSDQFVVLCVIARFGAQERYGSISPPRLSPGQYSPSSPQHYPASPQFSPVSPPPASLPPQLCPAVCPQLSPTRELPQLSDRQLAALETSFRVNRNPRHSDLMLLGVELQLNESQITVSKRERRRVEQRPAVGDVRFSGTNGPSCYITQFSLIN